MKEVIGVRFRTNGRIYYFDPLDNEVEVGTKVIVETSKGLEYGWVVLGRRQVEEEKVLPVPNEEYAAFEIPVFYFDRPMAVIADTVAMSEPHEIRYTLRFDSASLEASP